MHVRNRCERRLRSTWHKVEQCGMFLANRSGCSTAQSLIEESRARNPTNRYGGSLCRKFAGLVSPQRPEQPRWR
jgi:hypothetical protein